MPKVGPFKGLGFNNPTPQTEDLYIQSINTTTDDYRALLQELRAGKLALHDRDLDDGVKSRSGEYSLADEAYAELLAKLSAHHFELTLAPLRDNILAFYADSALPAENEKNPAQWQIIQTELSQLKDAMLVPSRTDKILPPTLTSR